MATKQPRRPGVRIPRPDQTGAPVESPTDSRNTTVQSLPSGATETVCLSPSTDNPSTTCAPGGSTPPGANAKTQARFIAWREAVQELVRAMRNLMALAIHPKWSDTTALWVTQQRELDTKLTNCRTAAAAVGNEAERVHVSRTLRRIQADAENYEKRLRPFPTDETEAQRWHAHGIPLIDRLLTALRNPAIAQEFEEAAISQGSSSAAQPAHQPQEVVPAPQYVTRDQIAALCGKSKKTVDRWVKKETIPLADIEGGGGKSDEWIWANVRPKLMEVSKRILPERYPSQLPPT